MAGPQEDLLFDPEDRFLCPLSAVLQILSGLITVTKDTGAGLEGFVEFGHGAAHGFTGPSSKPETAKVMVRLARFFRKGIHYLRKD